MDLVEQIVSICYRMERTNNRALELYNLAVCNWDNSACDSYIHQAQHQIKLFKDANDQLNNLRIAISKGNKKFNLANLDEQPF